MNDQDLKIIRQGVKGGQRTDVLHLFLVDSANDKIGGSEFSSSSSSLKLTFGRLPFCLAVPAHPFAAACEEPHQQPCQRLLTNTEHGPVDISLHTQYMS